MTVHQLRARLFLGSVVFSAMRSPIRLSPVMARRVPMRGKRRSAPRRKSRCYHEFMPMYSDERRIAALLRDLMLQSGTPTSAIEFRLGWEPGRLSELLAEGVSFEV